MAQARELLITARAGEPDTDRMEVVLVERDTSPWGTMSVQLTQDWQQIRVPLSEFRAYGHWTTEAKDRGGPEDRLHPERILWVNFCFGSWLYPGSFAHPHAIEIQDVSLK